MEILFIFYLQLIACGTFQDFNFVSPLSIENFLFLESDLNTMQFLGLVFNGTGNDIVVKTYA